MKCPNCAYEYDVDWSTEKKEFVPRAGDEKFLVIKGTFYVENTSWRGGDHEVDLIACPKCHIVILND